MYKYTTQSSPGRHDSGSSFKYASDWTDKSEEGDYAGRDFGADRAAVQA